MRRHLKLVTAHVDLIRESTHEAHLPLTTALPGLVKAAIPVSDKNAIGASVLKRTGEMVVRA